MSQILSAQGLGRLARRDEGRRGSPARLDPVKAGPLPDWPAGHTLACDHAGLLLLFPAMAQLGLSEMVSFFSMAIDDRREIEPALPGGNG